MERLETFSRRSGPTTTRNGRYVKVSRLIMQEILERDLLSDEEVHHKDNNPYNNCEDNLEVMKKVDHLKYHEKYRKESGNSNEAWCAKCKQFLDKSKFDLYKNRWNGVCPYCKKCKSEWHTKHKLFTTFQLYRSSNEKELVE